MSQTLDIIKIKESACPIFILIVQTTHTVGHFHVDGKNGRKLTRHLRAPMIESVQFSDAVESNAKADISEDENKLMSVSVNVENQESAAAVDASLARMLKSLAAEAEKAGPPFSQLDDRVHAIDARYPIVWRVGEIGCRVTFSWQGRLIVFLKSISSFDLEDLCYRYIIFLCMDDETPGVQFLLPVPHRTSC